MKVEKVRLCLALPLPLYERLQADSVKYGVPKTGIISMVLVNYYKENGSVTLPNFNTATD